MLRCSVFGAGFTSRPSRWRWRGARAGAFSSHSSSSSSSPSSSSSSRGWAWTWGRCFATACSQPAKSKAAPAAAAASASASSTTSSPSSSPFDLRALLSTLPKLPSQADLLTDTHHRRHTYLRVSLTERCNLRCQYCMPEEGVDLTPQQQLLTTQELEYLISLFASLGINKVRFTGGEPLIRGDLPHLIRHTAAQHIPTIAITTNGILLKSKLDHIVDAGLTHINISLDTLDPHLFSIITRRPAAGHTKVMQGIHAALGHPQLHGRVKINMVVIRGVNDHELMDFVNWTMKYPVEVRFIEYMPFTGNAWSHVKLLPSSELEARIMAAHPTLARLPPSDRNASSVSYRVHPDAPGTIGFISSMSNHFCSTCNRLRLMADGSIKVCLFGSAEISLRDALRAGATSDEMKRIIYAAIRGKKKQHAGMFHLAESTLNRPMIKIGG